VILVTYFTENNHKIKITSTNLEMYPIREQFTMIYQFNATRDEAAAAILLKDLPYRPTHTPDVISRQSIGSILIDRVPQSTQTGQIIPSNTEFYNPGSWMRHGDSTEMILAMAIFARVISSKRR
jgi:hypothetical protein